MKFSVSSSAICSKLVALSKVLNPNTNALPSPALQNILFEIVDNTLKFTASDGYNTLKTTMVLSESEGDCSFAVCCGDLIGTLSSLHEQPVTFEVNLTELYLKIEFQSGNYLVPIENSEIYPSQKTSPKDPYNTIVINSTILLDSINRSIFAIAEDDFRPVMNGIYFDLTTDCLALVASDGHKLVKNEIQDIKSDTPKSFVMPKKPITLLKSLLQKDGGDAIIRFDQEYAEVDYGDGTLSCRLIEGKYPNYNAVIPKNHTVQIKLSRTETIVALKRIKPFANQSGLIRFQLEDTLLTLVAESVEFNKKGIEKLPCEHEGESITIGFKDTSIIEAFSGLETSDVNILLSDPSRPALLLPSEQAEGQNVIILIMPMLINN